MAAPRDPALTEFVRLRLREYMDREKITQGTVATRVGVSEAFISNLLGGNATTGVAGRSAPGFAKLFGFGNEDSLRDAAYAWHLSHGAKTKSRQSEPAVAAALEFVRDLHPLVTDAQFRSMLNRFPDEAFDGRSEEFWTGTLLEEIKQDMLRARRRVGERHLEQYEQKRKGRVIEDAYREASKVKRVVAAQEEARTVAAEATRATEAAHEAAQEDTKPKRSTKRQA